MLANEQQPNETFGSFCRLTRVAAARYLTDRGLRIAAATLAAKATDGSGPAFSIWGNRAVYAVADLDLWAAERLGRPVSSTAERKS